MKKMVSFAILLAIIVASFFGINHLNEVKAAEEKDVIYVQATLEPTTESTAEVELPNLTVETAPEATVEPATEATPEPVVVEIDQETGKSYYKASTQEAVFAYIRQNVSASQAVDAIECVNFAASMVVDCDDPRIVAISAYELLKQEDFNSLEVKFDRNGNKLYGYSQEKAFALSSKEDKSFKGLADKKAYATWICQEHDAVKASVLVYEGYPQSLREGDGERNGYRGPFKVVDEFNPEVLKAVVLIKYDENRYDWVIKVCDCVDEKQQPTNSGGNGGSSKPDPIKKPTQEPTQAPTAKPTQAPTAKPTQAPTTEPTQAPTVEPTKAPAHEPESTLPPKATQAPAHEPESTLPPKQEPTVTRVPDIGPAHGVEQAAPEKQESQPTLPPKQEEAPVVTKAPNIVPAHGVEQAAPEKKEETSSTQEISAEKQEVTVASQPTLPPKKESSESAHASEVAPQKVTVTQAPVMGGVTF